VSVSSKSDEKGNIITEVHLSIITKAKPNVKIDDIPVINGFRGVSENDKQPIFRSINSPRSMHVHLYRDNIPQVTKFVCFYIRFAWELILVIKAHFRRSNLLICVQISDKILFIILYVAFEYCMHFGVSFIYMYILIL